MSAAFELPTPFLLLLPLSLAAGADFFLALLVLSLSMGPGSPVPGPEALHWGIPSVLLTLYLLEAGAELRPLPALLWHSGQLLFRPLGGGLLALALLDGGSTDTQLLGAFLGGILCAFTHVLTWGRKLLRFLYHGTRIPPLAALLAEDTLVLAFLLLSLVRPGTAFGMSAPLLFLGLLLGRPHHHLVRFGLSLARWRVWGFLDPPRWRGPSELPGWIGILEGEDETNRRRGVRAGVLGLPGSPGFLEGWMVEVRGQRWFVSRRRGKPKAAPLPSFDPEEGTGGPLAWIVPVSFPDAARSALFLQGRLSSLKSHK